jgi:hypothetical protein
MQSAVFRNKLSLHSALETSQKKGAPGLAGTPEYRVVSFVLIGKSILSGEA